MKQFIPLALVMGLVIFPSFSSAAHYIVGQVSDALDSTSANGRTVVLWNPSVGMDDNVTDIVGVTGNSGTDRTYLIDCELLNNSCTVSDTINITLVDDGSGYVARQPANITVTGAGFDLASNISMNTPPKIVNWTVDDVFTSPLNEIDLTAAANTTVYCTGIITEYDGIGTLVNYSSQFFSRNVSFANDTDDLNDHYTNNSCALNTSYGGVNDAFINCSYQVAYFAYAHDWICMVNLSDDVPVSSNYSDETVINPLLALGVNTSVDFGVVDAQNVSNDTSVEVINYGNVLVNLSLSGYGVSIEDGLAMQCEGGNISVEGLKYNLTDANPGPMDLSQTSQYYLNLTSNPSIKKFNLHSREDDLLNDAKNNTFWRIYVPTGVHGSCNGSIVFGAVQNGEV